MCCFSQPVEQVTNTQIFARRGTRGWQCLVYSMKFAANEDVAMILPLPVPRRVRENAVRFINLQGYPEFFTDMQSGFQVTLGRGGKKGGFGAGGILEVVEVGSFEASFVPTVKDFSRLDPRFRLPDGTWEALPNYRDYGFAVFKLKKDDQEVHPMAFAFPSRSKGMFFPTVHIHDGEVHERAEFDHTLYCQLAERDSQSVRAWQESPQLAGQFVNVRKAKRLVDADAHVYQKRIQGMKRNQDVWLT